LSTLSIRSRANDAIPALLTLAIGIGFAAWLIWLQPRPYEYPDTDLEQTYYSASRQAALGQRVWFCTHPGTPVAYAGGWLMRFTGTELERTQTFLNRVYVGNILLWVVALLVFDRLVLRRMPAALRCAGLLVASASPAVPRYLGQFGADPVLLSLCLIVVSLAWRAAERPSPLRWGLLGLVAGLTCAVKLSAGPLALAVAMALTCHAAFAGGRPGPRLLALGLLAAGIGLGFAVGTGPQFEQMGSVLAFNSSRDIVKTGWLAPLRLVRGFGGGLLHFSGGWVALLLFAGAGTGWASLRWLRHYGTASHPTRAEGLAKLVLPAACAAAAAWIASKANLRFDPATDLRQAIPVATAFNLALPLAWWMSDPASPGLRRLLAGVVPAGAVIALVWTTLVFSSERRAFLDQCREAEASATRLCARIRPPGGRVLVWDGPNSKRFGKAHFHLWASHFYAQNQHNREVLEAFPDLGLIGPLALTFHFFEVAPPPPVKHPRSRFGPLGNLYWFTRLNKHTWDSSSGERTLYVRDDKPSATLLPMSWDNSWPLQIRGLAPLRQWFASSMAAQAGGPIRVLEVDHERWLVASPPAVNPAP